MLIAAAFTASMMGLLAFALLVCVVAATLLRKPVPVASAHTPSDVGGSLAGFDILPCVTSKPALVPPLAGPPPPSGLDSPKLVRATGRDLNKDYYCADDVALTITDKEVWLEVDKDNLVRVKRIKRLHVDDRR